jgi:hypothetical protein
LQGKTDGAAISQEQDSHLVEGCPFADVDYFIVEVFVFYPRIWHELFVTSGESLFITFYNLKKGNKTEF